MAFLSCTYDFDKFIDHTGLISHLAVLQINVDSPQLCINVGKVLPDFSDEGEYILPRNTRLQLNSINHYSGIEEFASFIEIVGSVTSPEELNSEMSIEEISLYNMEILA